MRRISQPSYIAIAALLWGLFITFYQTMRTGFSMLPGDNGDGRFNHYILEHGWQWISGNPLHSEFWNAPFFYPTENVMAYSDILLGTAPIYWFNRLVGFNVFSSFQLWLAALCILNFSSFYLLLRRIFNFSQIPSASGAFLFAFCAPRIFKFGHIQMAAAFFSVFFIYFICKFYQSHKDGSGNAPVFLSAAAACLVLQLYAGFYLGWFLVFGVSVFFPVTVLFPGSRKVVFDVIRLRYPSLLICAILSAAALYPMASHYLEAQGAVGSRSFGEVASMMPRLESWFNGPSFIYRRLRDFSLPMSHEHLIGIGFFSLITCIVGLYFTFKRNIWGKCLVVTAFIVFFLPLWIMNGVIWRVIWEIYPGASAIRALVRIFYFLLIALSIGFAAASQRRGFLGQCFLAAVLIAESFMWGIFVYDRDRAQTLVAEIAEHAEKFDGPFLLLSGAPDLESANYMNGLDAMWASLMADRPTINGYSGWAPRDYRDINEISFDSPIDSAGYLDSINGQILIIQNSGGVIRSRTWEPAQLPADLDKSYEEITIVFNDRTPDHEAVRKIYGLFPPEGWGRWSAEKKVGFSFWRPLPSSFRLRLTLQGFGPNIGRETALRIGETQYRFVIPGNMEDVVLNVENPTRESRFEIDVPEPVSPLKLSVSEDSRPLGIGFVNLSIVPND
ncbi:hypothetical protein C4J81_19230 (plasmid) [Deltaproteobacteria bacterium Smac51]|nr:hypothetical protein C4J81_19230 [Deltaproteobacteria bacterium Smac51]